MRQNSKFRLLILFCLPAVVIIGTLSCGQNHPQRKIDVSELTITDIHQYYQSGKLSAEELVQTYLDRIANLDTFINAITSINPKAIQQARALDKEFVETGELRPLHGIPILVKDNFNTQGMITSAGALALKDFIPSTNATMIDQLLDAGVIIIAKTNMAEWAFSPMHTESSTHGTTRNPYNLSHVPAGSSGGTAAGIATNLGAIGLGTDTGNSIRGPSSHCALVGYRSTLGLTSRSGIVPLYLRNDVAGPMCRTVEDATRVLEVIAGYDPLDPVTVYCEGKIPENYTQFLKRDGLQNARIGVLSHLSNVADPAIKGLFEKAINDIRAQGAQVLDSVLVPDF